jgi:hypothetical protein
MTSNEAFITFAPIGGEGRVRGRFIIALLGVFLCCPARADELAWLQARIDVVTPQAAPMFVTSYDVKPGGDGFDLANADSAYTYDNALVLLALLSAGDTARARRIGDAFVWAGAHDRAFHDGRLRNAYASGIVTGDPVKLPGYYDQAKKLWIEDGYQVGSATGNNAWAGLALLRLADATGDRRYAEAAQRIGRFLVDTVGATSGFRGGFEEFEPHQQVLGWKSTEHNADALAFLRLLEKAYPGQGFGDAAGEAQDFIATMWLGDHYATGTLTDGKTVNAAYSSLDAQTFTALALISPLPGGEADAPGVSGEGTDRINPLTLPSPRGRGFKSMAWLQRTHGVDGGLDYSDARAAIWPEGTAQAALVYKLLGDTKSADALIAACETAEAPDGGIYAVQGADQLQTKLKLGNGEGSEWYYYRRLHIAPTAWVVMAKAGYDPLAAN